MTSSTEQAPSEPVIACTLDDGELARRRRGLLAEVASLAVERRRLTDGVEIVLPGSEEAIDLAVRLMTAERQCCRFLRFQLALEPDLGPMALAITGPPGTADAVEVLLGL